MAYYAESAVKHQPANLILSCLITDADMMTLWMVYDVQLLLIPKSYVCPLLQWKQSRAY